MAHLSGQKTADVKVFKGWSLYELFQKNKPDLVILCRWIMSSDKKEFTLLYTYNLI